MMTTNIKALAEKIKLRHEKEHDAAISVGYPYDLQDKDFYPDYIIATALLKVLEDGERLYEALDGTVAAIDAAWCKHILVMKEDRQALESHEKLMEELGGE